MSKRTSSRTRGEVSEMCNALEHLSTMSGSKPDVIKMKRDCFQRLIRYMTQGIDMSAALVPATKCVALSRTDVPLKKMLYLYLRTSARRNGSVALLVVQTLLNDCKDVDATIRGAALRSMCSLRVPELEEAVLAAISAGLGDPHPYVREAAVLGVLKMWEQSPGGVRTHGFADAVRSLLGTDADPQVVANCLVVLEGLGALKEPISRALVIPLLNHIRAFSDWAQCQVLELVLRYEPDTAQERYDVLEVLDFALGSPNSAVFLAAARLFLRYTQGDAEQHRRVLSRLLDPLLTLVQSRQAEVVWAVLCNVLVLARRGKGDGVGPTPAQLALAPLLPALRPRVEDPTLLKTLKLELMAALATPPTAHDVAEELGAWLFDGDAELARAAARGLADVALSVPSADGVLDRLLLLLGRCEDAPEAGAEALVALARALRARPGLAPLCLPAAARVEVASLDSGEARAALAWALGAHGAGLQEAPYILEALVERAASEGDEAELVSAVCACARLFLARPPETRPALGAALAAAAASSHAGARDVARLAMRLLRDVAEQEQEADVGSVLAAADAALDAAALHLSAPPGAGGKVRVPDARAQEMEDRLFDELNTLAAVYRLPAAVFLDGGDGGAAEGGQDMGGGGEGDGLDGEGAFEEQLLSHEDSHADLVDLEESADNKTGAYAAPPPLRSAPADGVADLLGFGDAEMARPGVPPGGAAEEFAQLWNQLPGAARAQQMLPGGALSAITANKFKDFISFVGQADLECVRVPASSAGPLHFEFQSKGGSRRLARVTVEVGSPSRGTVECRAEAPAAAEELSQTMQTLLLSL